MVDLAIGVIIGAAFGKIVDSLVGDIFMPIIDAATGGLDFSNYFVPLSDKVTATALEQAKAQGAVVAWGSFVTIAINFIIIAWALFLVVRAMNRMRVKEDAKAGTADKAPEIPADVKLLTEIRDLLQSERRAGPIT